MNYCRLCAKTVAPALDGVIVQHRARVTASSRDTLGCATCSEVNRSWDVFVGLVATNPEAGTSTVSPALKGVIVKHCARVQLSSRDTLGRAT